MDTRPPDIYIDEVPFKLKSYSRSNTDDMIARFGSAEKGDTNLDTLKVATQKSFRGGMFQRVSEDPEMVSSISGGYYNPLDDAFYFSPKATQATIGINLGAGGVNSWCWWRGLVYFTYASPSTPVGNGMATYNPTTDVVTPITIPTPLVNSQYRLSITAFDDYIYVGFQGSNNVTPSDAYRMTTGHVFTMVTGNFMDFFEFRSKLYGVAWHNALMSITDHASNPIKWTKIKDVGLHDPSVISTYQGSIVFNGAAYLAFQTGLYRFDGVDIDIVIDMNKNPNAANFKYMAVYNGRLYYTIGNTLYSFDGVNITIIQSFSIGYQINRLETGGDRLWIGAFYDKAAASVDSFPSFEAVEHVLFAYNSVGFYLYKKFGRPDSIKSTTHQYGAPAIFPVKDKLVWIATASSPTETPTWGVTTLSTINIKSEFSAGSMEAGQTIEVFGSEEDAGYPVVPKSLIGVSIDYESLNEANFHVYIEAIAKRDGVWGSWTKIWDNEALANSVTKSYKLYDQAQLTSGGVDTFFATSPMTYDTIKYRLTVVCLSSTATTMFRARKLSLRYTIQPELRKQWLLTLSLEALLDSNDAVVHSASYFRNVLDAAIQNKRPVLFYDADFTAVKGNNVLPALKIQKPDFVNSGQFIAVKNGDSWLNRKVTVSSVTADDSTLELKKTGYRQALGASSSSDVADGMEVRKSHAVFLTSVQNERYILDENSISLRNGSSDIPSDITIILKEV